MNHSLNSPRKSLKQISYAYVLKSYVHEQTQNTYMCIQFYICFMSVGTDVENKSILSALEGEW